MNLSVEQRMDADREEIAQIITRCLDDHPIQLSKTAQETARMIAEDAIREYISRGWVRVAMHPIASIHKVIINGVEVELL